MMLRSLEIGGSRKRGAITTTHNIVAPFWKLLLHDNIGGNGGGAKVLHASCCDNLPQYKASN